jgi:hypothetical protein
MIVSTALVMMMTPAGLALFYGGMSRYKNLLNTLAMTFVSYCLASVIWMMWGYTLAFGPSKGGIIGGFDHLFHVRHRCGQPVRKHSHLCFRPVPDDLRRHHRGPGAGFGGGPHEILRLDRLSPPCGSLSSTAPSPTGSGAAAGWGPWAPSILPAATWCTSTPVWPGWCLSLVLGKRIGYGKEAMFPFQHHPDRPGCRPAVVRLVRFQCRQPAGGRRRGRFGLSGHQHLRRHGGPDLDVLRMDRHRQTDGSGHRFGCRRRTGGHHACRRVRGAARHPDHRPGVRRAGLLFRCRGQTERSATTTRWMPSASTACAASGVPWPRACSPTRPSPKARSGCFTAIPDSSGPSCFHRRHRRFTAVGTLIVTYVTKALTGGLRVEHEEERSRAWTTRCTGSVVLFEIA